MSVIKLNITQVNILANALLQSVATINLPRIRIDSDDGNSISLHVKTEKPRSTSQAFYLEISTKEKTCDTTDS